MKYLFIVLDGASDKNYKILKNQSPISFAKTPTLDKLASMSKLGRVEVVGKNIAPESDSAVMSLLGYDVKKYYPGRGVIESIGAGWKIRKDSIYFRANFATINENWELIDTRAGRISSKIAEKLSKSINSIKIKGAKFEFKHTIGHRGVLRVKAKNLSHNITGNNNYYEEIKGLKIHEAKIFSGKFEKLKSFKPRDKSLEAKSTAMLMNLYIKLVHEVLSKNPINKKRKIPANILLLRGAGNQVPHLLSMKKLTGLNWAALVEMPVEEGICKLTNMGLIFVGKESDTSVLKTKKYLKKTLQNMKKFDALYIHIKGPDLPSHDGDLKKKIKILEDIDKHFFSPLLKKIDLDNTSIIVTSDHSTECALKSHTNRPTALLFYKPKIKNDDFKKLTENNCSKGSLGLIKGNKVIRLFS